VDDVHGPHGPARVVENPLFVQIHVGGVLSSEVIHDIRHHAGRVVSMHPDGIRRQLGQFAGRENVKPFQVGRGHVHGAGEQAEDGAEDEEEARHRKWMERGSW
jgi:hypothetical protein